MAILKHLTSKNADYGEAQRYLIYKYDESTKKPILNKNGTPQQREEYFMDGINCDPFAFDMECRELNAKLHKNQNFNDIKSHHYILSFDPKDKDEHGLTGKQAQQLALDFARKCFPGHQILVCTHTNGNNESGNIHTHIVLNSLRKFDVEHQEFMERASDSRAGYKHHLTKKYLAFLKQEVMNMCHRENLYQVDLLTPAEKRITDREYRNSQRGQQNLEQLNQQMVSDGVTPRHSKYQTQKQFLREAIEDVACSAISLEEFQKDLSEKYGISVKECRGRFSYLHPERKKWITSRSLGANYQKEYIIQILNANALSKETEHIELGQADLLTSTPMSVIFIKSDLRLVTDLQACIKAQQSQTYARKVKLTNLKEMARTVAYIQEHGYDTRDKLEESYLSIKSQMKISRKELTSTEAQLKEINEQIHYTGQYLSNKAVYSEFCKCRKKGKFRQEHSSEIALYETARKILKEKSGGQKLPSMKLLKEKKAELLKQKKMNLEQYHYYHDYQKELHTVCSNVDSILGQGHFQKTEPHKEHTIS